MVVDEVWASVADGADYLCVGCVEDRLDRCLAPEDFIPVPLNDDDETDSVRLRVRKGSGRRTESLYRWGVAAVLDLGRDLDEVAEEFELSADLLATWVGNALEEDQGTGCQL